MTRPGPDEVHRAVEDVVRASYGRLVGFLASRSGDLAGAEDALSDALAAALRSWPERGVPDRPDSWLLTAARHNLIDAARHEAVRTRHLPELARAIEQHATDDPEGPIADRRLALMLACTHPAIDLGVRSPLMLQVVLGLDAARIAAAFLVAPATMGQRLVRAKAKLREAGVAFEIPDPEVLPDRLSSVLDAIYAAYGTGWDRPHEPDGSGGDDGLVAESLRLAEVVVELAPGQPEAHGLLALLCHSHARRAARRSADGRYVPLDEQDPDRWDRASMARAEHHLTLALALGRTGPFQLHAAVQSVHNRRALTGTTDWTAIAALYEGLVRLTPTVGVHVARAAATVHARGPVAGLRQLDELPLDRVADYQPYWATRAHALRRTGDASGAEDAAAVAARLTTDPAVRDFLLARA